jgi:hypothetical protein
LYGWFNLIFVQWGGFGLETLFVAERLVQGSQMGVVFGVLTAILAALLLEPADGERDRTEPDPSLDQSIRGPDGPLH